MRWHRDCHPVGKKSLICDIFEYDSSIVRVVTDNRLNAAVDAMMVAWKKTYSLRPSVRSNNQSSGQDVANMRRHVELLLRR